MSDPSPPSEFFEELAEAFRRYRPQGSLEWNFAAAFEMLDNVAAEAAAWSGPSEPTTGSEGHLADRLRLPGKLRPSAKEKEPVEDTVLRRAVAGDLEATLGALRFLAARVERLERAAALQRQPVEGTEWLLEPPGLDAWTEPVAEWIVGAAPHGEALVAECGHGELAAELASHGMRVEGIEPRGSVAWRAAERGVEVRLASVGDTLAALPRGVLGAVVLVDVVDRVALEDLVVLLRQAVEAAVAEAPIVVFGREVGYRTGPGAEVLPGRPLPPETWAVLLERMGCREVEWDTDHLSPPGERVHCIRGRRVP